MGPSRNASYMVVLVSSPTPSSFKIFTYASRSILLFITCILSFVWRTGSAQDLLDRTPLSPHAALGPRIAITALFGLGLIYFLLIVKTFSRYGDSMDRAWRQRMMGWAMEYNYMPVSGYPLPHLRRSASNEPMTYSPIPVIPRRPESFPWLQSPSSYSTNTDGRGGPTVTSVQNLYPNTPPPCFTRPFYIPQSYPVFKTTKIMDLNSYPPRGYEMPPILRERDIRQEDWERFIRVCIFPP